jgi:hypothetical protein
MTNENHIVLIFWKMPISTNKIRAPIDEDVIVV